MGEEIVKLLNGLDLSSPESRKEVGPASVKMLLAALEEDDLEIKYTLDCLRALRVLVVGSNENASFFLDFLNNRTILQDLVTIYLGCQEILLARILMQVVANSVNQNTGIQNELREKLLKVAEMIYKDCPDAKVRNLTSCVILSLMKNSEDYSAFLLFMPSWLQLVQEESEHFEYGLLCLKQLLSDQWMEGLDEKYKDDILNILPELDLGDDVKDVGLHGIVDSFTFLTDTILTTTLGSVDDLNPDVIINLLEIIIKISKSYQQTVLQGKQSLLINTVYLLRMVHETGKQEGGNAFTPLSRLKDFEKQDAAVEDLPVYGFKGNLIQLLVNLVWENTENKSLVGELEGVQLLLDCSQLDGKNPLITQWVIMSVKALCDQHPENQKILLGLRPQGAADATLLKELGIKLPPPKTHST